MSEQWTSLLFNHESCHHVMQFKMKKCYQESIEFYDNDLPENKEQLVCRLVPNEHTDVETRPFLNFWTVVLLAK